MPWSSAHIDGVTVDAMGTLVELVDPVPRLQDELDRRGVRRDAETVRAAFAAEVEYYIPHAHEGRDEPTLQALRRRCTAVFLAGAEADLEPAEFAPAFVGALAFRPLPGAVGALELLRAAGLSVACVSNWDVSLAVRLEEAGLTHLLDTVVSSAETGAPKPDPRPFLAALERLRVSPERALHVGDGDTDEQGAAAAGLHFEHAPLATLPERLGLRASS